MKHSIHLVFGIHNQSAITKDLCVSIYSDSHLALGPPMPTWLTVTKCYDIANAGISFSPLKPRNTSSSSPEHRGLQLWQE